MPVANDFEYCWDESPYRVFISEDPIRLRGGDINFYVRTGNDPVNYIDPYGLVSTRPSGLTFIQWWGIRVGLGAITGVPLTVGAGMGLFNPTELGCGTIECNEPHQEPSPFSNYNSLEKKPNSNKQSCGQ